MRPVRAAGSRWGGSPSPWPGDLPRQHRIMVHWALGDLRPPFAAKKSVCRRAATPVLGFDRHKAAPDLRFCPSGHSHQNNKTTPSPQRQCRRRTGRAIPPCPQPQHPCAQNPNPTDAHRAPRRRPGPQSVNHKLAADGPRSRPSPGRETARSRCFSVTSTERPTPPAQQSAPNAAATAYRHQPRSPP